MKSLFVGNMSFQTSEAELRELFAPFGQVTRVHMAMDRETGRARGFAFIEMPNDAEAARHAVPEILADRAEEAAGDAARAADATASRTKITVSRRGSRASHAGSFPFPWMGCTARDQGPRRTLL